ncbi:Uncharacterized protein TCM_018506 [Theobroma cacao]|uniref:Uncharacterized protein n=1 Tax=Theobroma cacao TaxID=3641 RepID=A0A061EGB8_THECC|nr:Uncharacterized protein TCM_018506 [Theobroma cacao]
MSLRDTLNKTTEGTASIFFYMHTIKPISDTLATIGAPLYDDEVVFHVLNGLGSDFKEIGVVIHASRIHKRKPTLFASFVKFLNMMLRSAANYKLLFLGCFNHLHLISILHPCLHRHIS